LKSVENALLEWVDWFNDTRLLGRIGHTPPVERERAYYTQDEPLAMAAGLT
jgi:putative transposase